MTAGSCHGSALDATNSVGSTERASALSGLAEAAELPGLLDVEALVPPTSRAHVRRVAGRNLWVWYRVEPDEIVAVLVTKTPPVPAT